MIKLSDLQSLLLATAASRDTSSLVPLPATIKTPAAGVAKSLASLLAKGLAEEREVTDAALAHRSDGDLRYGLFITAAGTPAHATKGKTRYRYYVSRSLHLKQTATGIRIPAREIEKLVATRLAELVDDPIQLIATAWLEVPADRLEPLHQRCFELAGQLRGLNRDAVTALVHQVRLGEHGVEVDCRIPAVACRLDARAHPDAPEIITLQSDVTLNRDGRFGREPLDTAPSCRPRVCRQTGEIWKESCRFALDYPDGVSGRLCRRQRWCANCGRSCVSHSTRMRTALRATARTASTSSPNRAERVA